MENNLLKDHVNKYKHLGERSDAVPFIPNNPEEAKFIQSGYSYQPPQEHNYVQMDYRNQESVKSVCGFRLEGNDKILFFSLLSCSVCFVTLVIVLLIAYK